MYIRRIDRRLLQMGKRLRFATCPSFVPPTSRAYEGKYVHATIQSKIVNSKLIYQAKDTNYVESTFRNTLSFTFTVLKVNDNAYKNIKRRGRKEHAIWVL